MGHCCRPEPEAETRSVVEFYPDEEETTTDTADPETPAAESQAILNRVVDFARKLREARMKQQLEHYAKVDLEAGKRFPRKYWNDLDTSFVYTMDDIPQVSAECFSFLKLKVAHFKGLDNWTAVLYDRPWRGIRKRLHDRIRKYCKTVRADPDWVPKKGQIIFVRVSKCINIFCLGRKCKPVMLLFS